MEQLPLQQHALARETGCSCSYTSCNCRSYGSDLLAFLFLKVVGLQKKAQVPLLVEGLLVDGHTQAVGACAPTLAAASNVDSLVVDDHNQAVVHSNHLVQAVGSHKADSQVADSHAVADSHVDGLGEARKDLVDLPEDSQEVAHTLAEAAPPCAVVVGHHEVAGREDQDEIPEVADQPAVAVPQVEHRQEVALAVHLHPHLLSSRPSRPRPRHWEASQTEVQLSHAPQAGLPRQPEEDQDQEPAAYQAGPEVALQDPDTCAAEACQALAAHVDGEDASCVAAACDPAS